MSLVQVAISSTHLLRSHDWYCRALGFLSAGRLRHHEVVGRGRVSGLPEAALDVWCVMGREELMQVELFEFSRPRMRGLPADWRVSDIGYAMVGISTVDFDISLERIRSSSGRPLTEIRGDVGNRHVCIRDPDGVVIEMRESVPVSARRVGWPAVPVAVRFVTLSVHDLKSAVRFWVDGLGLTVSDLELHRPDDEALWGLPGASRDCVVIDAGGTYIELVQYHFPRPRWRQAGYLISDQGILNVALGTKTITDFMETYERAVSRGYQANSAPVEMHGASVVYINDLKGVNVELMCVPDNTLATIGFVPDDEDGGASAPT